jgi:hypothetical protein
VRTVYIGDHTSSSDYSTCSPDYRDKTNRSVFSEFDTDEFFARLDDKTYCINALDIRATCGRVSGICRSVDGAWSHRRLLMVTQGHGLS